MLPKRRNEFDLLEEMFVDPFFSSQESKVMKTDIKENENNYLIDIELPGYEKENIKMDIEDGYLTVQAKINNSKEEKEGSYVRKERYIGSCKRSFYIGEEVQSDEIKASFKNGILKINVPKKEPKKELPEKKYIQIED